MGTNSRKQRRGITNKDIQHWAYEIANDPEFNTGEIGPDATSTQVMDPIEIVFTRDTGEQVANRTINGGDKIRRQATKMSKLKARRQRRQLRTSPESRAPQNYQENREWTYEHATPEQRREMNNTQKFADFVKDLAMGITMAPADLATGSAGAIKLGPKGWSATKEIGKEVGGWIGNKIGAGSKLIYEKSPQLLKTGFDKMGVAGRWTGKAARGIFDAAFRPSWWTNKIDQLALRYGSRSLQNVTGLANRFGPYADIGTNLYWDYEAGKGLYDMATGKTQFSPIGAAWDLWILKNSPRVLKGSYRQAKWDYNSLKDRYGFLADPRARTFGFSTENQLLYDTGWGNPVGRQNIPPMNGGARLSASVGEPITTDIGIRVSPNGEVAGYRNFDGHTLRINPETGNPQFLDDVVNPETYRNIGKGLGITVASTAPAIGVIGAMDWLGAPYDPNNYAEKYGIDPEHLPLIYESNIGENMAPRERDQQIQDNLVRYLSYMDYVKNVPQFPINGEGNYDKNEWFLNRFRDVFGDYYDKQINNVENGGTYTPLTNDRIQDWVRLQRTDSIWNRHDQRWAYRYNKNPEIQLKLDE